MVFKFHFDRHEPNTQKDIIIQISILINSDSNFGHVLNVTPKLFYMRLHAIQVLAIEV